MGDSEKRAAGIRRMELWWEFSKSPEGRGLNAAHGARMKVAFQEWYVREYPEEARIEYEKRTARLDVITEALRKGRK